MEFCFQMILLSQEEEEETHIQILGKSKPSNRLLRPSGSCYDKQSLMTYARCAKEFQEQKG